MRGEALRQTVKHGAAGACRAANGRGIAVDRVAMLGDQHLLGLRPFGFVETRRVADLQRIDRVPTEVEPVSELCHGYVLTEICGRCFPAASGGTNASRVSGIAEGPCCR